MIIIINNGEEHFMKIRYLILALIIFSTTSIFIGVSEVSIFDLFNLSEDQAEVLFVSRIPRLFSILVAGASMSICGLIMQQLSRNKFVSPTTAGTLDSARFGVLISMLLFTGAGAMVKMAVSFAFALLGTFIFMKILERIKFKDAIFIPLEIGRASCRERVSVSVVGRSLQKCSSSVVRVRR